MWRAAAAAIVGLSVIAGGQPAALSDSQQEEFLRTARIIKSRETDKGVTASVRATMTDGTLTHDVHIQSVDISRPEFQVKGRIEFNFRDDWRFNVAVYRIDRLLGLNLVPVSIERTWRNERAAFTWWVDEVRMDEGERLKKNIAPPDADCWAQQVRSMRLLDALIDNSDRNLGNTLITTSWRLWAIDHTRAFRYSSAPRNVGTIVAMDRDVLARLEALDFATLKRLVGEYVTDRDIRNVLSRRDGIVEHFRKLGEPALFTRKDPAAGCSRSSV
jgi:hypothetical protein